MKILELYKRFLREEYKNNVKKMIEAEDGLIFTQNNIIDCFCGGYIRPRTLEEATKQLKRYMQDNKQYCLFYDMETGKFI